MSLASRKEIAFTLGICAAAGAFLAAGFLGVAQGAGEWVGLRLGFDEPGLAWAMALAGVLLAGGFHLSVPSRGTPTPYRPAWLSLPVAFGLALLYGAAMPGPGELWIAEIPQRPLVLSYTLLWAPLTEEFLFRGWLYSIAQRLCPKLATPTNPLPVAAWATAIAFSLWHLQNFGSLPAGTVAFQVAYTLPLGLWLGWLRWQTGGLLAPIAAHVAVNLGTALA